MRSVLDVSSCGIPSVHHPEAVTKFGGTRMAFSNIRLVFWPSSTFSCCWDVTSNSITSNLFLYFLIHTIFIYIYIYIYIYILTLNQHVRYHNDIDANKSTKTNGKYRTKLNVDLFGIFTPKVNSIHLWLRYISFGGRSAHFAHHVHKSGRKTPIVISHHQRPTLNLSISVPLSLKETVSILTPQYIKLKSSISSGREFA